MAKQWIDYKQGTDTGYENSDSIQPVADGETANQTVFRRPSENLRQRTEIVRDAVEENLYLRDADRALTVWGGGNIAWNGTSTVAGNGKFTITADLYVAPITGIGDSGSTPEVASVFGTLTLQKTGPANGIVVTSKKRNYEGGDKISVEIILDNGIGGNTQITVAGTPANKIQIKVKNTTTLNHVITDVAANVTANALVGMALAGGAASGDIILSPQAEQYIQGNWDSELHVITAANLASFFTTPANVLEDGDALCIWYNNNIEGTVSADTSDPKGGVLGGRRESIVENSNYTIPVGSLFNSRVNPERLPNSIPVCRVVQGGTRLKFIDGTTFVYGAPAYPLDIASTLKSDLASTTASKGASMVGINDAGSVFTATTVEGALAELDTEKVAKSGDTMTGNLLPNSTGLDLGSGAAFWDAFLNNVTLNGDLNPVSPGGSSIGNSNKLALLGSRRAEIDNTGGTTTDIPLDVVGDPAQDSYIVRAKTGTADATFWPLAGFMDNTGATRTYLDNHGFYRPKGYFFYDPCDYALNTNANNLIDAMWGPSFTGSGAVTASSGGVSIVTGAVLNNDVTMYRGNLGTKTHRPMVRACISLYESFGVPADRVFRVGIASLAYVELDTSASANWRLVIPSVSTNDLGINPAINTGYIITVAIIADNKIQVSISSTGVTQADGSLLNTVQTIAVPAGTGSAYVYSKTRTGAAKTSYLQWIEAYTNRVVY